MHLQNGVIREGTSGETSTIPLVGIPNGALHSQVREYPSVEESAFASLLVQLGFRLRSRVLVMPEGGGTLVGAAGPFSELT